MYSTQLLEVDVKDQFTNEPHADFSFVSVILYR